VACDNPFMNRALELAAKSDGAVQPNPYVGAVLVKNNTIIAEGRHERYGEAHAEVNALSACNDPKGADMYVTLEPCSHFGKTPPCADAIISAGIKRVFIAMEDPNPLVGGAGIRKLKQAGIEITVGMGNSEARLLNKIFLKNILRKEPYIIIKYAMSADGYIAGKDGDSKWISNEQSRDLVHHIRHNIQAVLVGSGTVETDDPQLTARLYEGGFQPRPVVLDMHGTLPHTSFKALHENAVIITGNEKKLAQTPAKVYTIPKKEPIKSFFLDVLRKENISSVLVEGGSRTIGTFLDAGLFDEVLVFVSPIFLLGGIPAASHGDGYSVRDAVRLERTSVTVLGETTLIRGYNKHVHWLD